MGGDRYRYLRGFPACFASVLGRFAISTQQISKTAFLYLRSYGPNDNCLAIVRAVQGSRGTAVGRMVELIRGLTSFDGVHIWICRDSIGS